MVIAPFIGDASRRHRFSRERDSRGSWAPPLLPGLAPMLSRLQPKSMVKEGMVNGGGLSYLPAAKIKIFRDFAYKNANLKVR
jgi:hypothetical protein